MNAHNSYSIAIIGTKDKAKNPRAATSNGSVRVSGVLAALEACVGDSSGLICIVFLLLPKAARPATLVHFYPFVDDCFRAELKRISVSINPITMIAILGKNVSNAKIPKPTGFGFGSFVRPKAASEIMVSRGPLPMTSVASPTQNTFDIWGLEGLDRADAADGFVSTIIKKPFQRVSGSNARIPMRSCGVASQARSKGNTVIAVFSADTASTNVIRKIQDVW